VIIGPSLRIRLLTARRHCSLSLSEILSPVASPLPLPQCSPVVIPTMVPSLSLKVSGPHPSVLVVWRSSWPFVYSKNTRARYHEIQYFPRNVSWHSGRVDEYTRKRASSYALDPASLQTHTDTSLLQTFFTLRSRYSPPGEPSRSRVSKFTPKIPHVCVHPFRFHGLLPGRRGPCHPPLSSENLCSPWSPSRCDICSLSSPLLPV